MASDRPGAGQGQQDDRKREHEWERRASALTERYRCWIRCVGVLTELGGRLADRFDRELERLEEEARR